MKGKKHQYDTFTSSFTRPEIQGLLETSIKSGILNIGRDGNAAKNHIVSTTELGLVVLVVDDVSECYLV